MVYTQLIGAGLSLYGGYLGSQAQKKAEAQLKAENKRRREAIIDASEQAATEMQQSANPLFSQATGAERASRYRDPLVEQGLVAGLRQQAGAQAAQDRQTGGGDRRGAVVGQLLRGQGLLAAESQRIQRFTQMSQMAAGLRSQGAQIMGQASQVRMQGLMAAADITDTYSGASPWAVGLGALGGAIGDMSDSDFGWGGDGTEDLSGFNNSTGPVPDVIAPDPLPLPQAATSDIRDFDSDSLDFDDNFEPLAPMGLGSQGDYRAPANFGKPPPVRRLDRDRDPHIRFDESSAPLGGPFGQEQGLGPDTRRGDGSGMFNRNEWELEKIMQPRAGQPKLPSSHRSWYKDWSNSWWR